MVLQILHCLFGGMYVGFVGFLNAIGVYNTLSNLKEQIIASFFGVPTILITILSFLLLVGSIVKKKSDSK